YPGFAMPWIVSNPIYVGDAPASGPGAPAAMPAPANAILDLLPLAGWRVEHDATSTASFDRSSGGIEGHFALGAGIPAGQYAAFVVPVASEDGIDRIQIRARAERPMRVSIQVRLPGASGGQRWRRSLYIDADDRLAVLPLQTFEPADRPTSQRPI